MPFPQSFFNLLIIASLILMSFGALSLVVMLIRDIKSNKLW